MVWWVRHIVFPCTVGMLLACALACVGCGGASASHSGSNPSDSTSQVVSTEVDAVSSADMAISGRGSILACDGSSLAETLDGAGDGARPERAYSLGEAAEPLVGSCYTHGVFHGVEQEYADDLAQGKSVTLTIDPAIQRAAYQAIEGHTAAAVVLDPDTGAVIAMAQSPSFDPSSSSASDPQGLEDRATELHIPGSTFKTITLAAALESGATLQDYYPGPAEVTFEGGSVVNFNTMQYPAQTLLQAYAKSINTIFAQLTVKVGFDEVYAMAHHFGFDRQLMSDYPLRESLICNADILDLRMQAWTGVGQALYQSDGELHGPVMSPIHGAVLASAIVNGGKLVSPYVVESVDGVPLASERPSVLDEGFLSPDTLDALQVAMRAVVKEGTGSNAQVEGIDIGGKTGTAETVSGEDDAWFIGFAQTEEKRYAVCVLLEGEQSTDAARVASGLIRALFE